jgi:ABC-type bacteriocin/lantibiotic exporter with double-glycine peptidase domain
MFSLSVWPFVDNPHKYMPTEENLKTNYVKGTEPKEIELYLQSLGIDCQAQEFADVKALKLPAMVLYQWGGEGHYGVVVKAYRNVHIFNPYNAKIDRMSLKEFESRWYDEPEYRWALTIT